MLNIIIADKSRMSGRLFAGACGRKINGHCSAWITNFGRFSRVISHLLAAIFLAAGVANAVAADRVFLGDTQDISLAASTDPDTVGNLNLLRQQAAHNGKVRLIVGVRAAYAPEGLMSAGNVSLQRSQITAEQSRVLDSVAALKQNPGRIKRFSNIPFMAVEADPAALEALSSQPDVTSIEEDRLVASSLWVSVPLIGGTAAWASGYTGAGQTIAILDTGVDKTHPFLTGKVVSEACYSSNYSPDGATSICPGGVTSSTSAGSALPYAGTCPAGQCDHGTHVAGIAAGNNGSYSGHTFSGVAKDASLIAIQVFSRFDSVANCGSSTPCVLSYTSDEILGLQQVYALRNTYNIAAVNLSLGGGQYSSQSACDADNTSIKTAIDTLRSVNIATVIAAGNGGYSNSLSAPGCISSAVSVGATYDQTGWINNCLGNSLGNSAVDHVACYSNSASFLSLLAPGSVITSSIPGGGYAAWQGTSMATPHVSGTWAIMKQADPGLTVSDGLSALSSTGVQVTDPRNSIVKPRIQIDAALNAIAAPACIYALGSNSLTTGAGAAVGNVNVTAGTGCAWTATNNVNWITVTSGSSGNGNGSVGYSVAANSGAASRIGTLTIAGQTFTITQAGASVSNINVALASNGGIASASSTFSSGYPAAALIDNQRTGAPWGNGGSWKDATSRRFPDWVQINFSGQQSIDHVVVYTLQDNYTNPVEPTDTMTFTKYGVTDFTVQGWNGTAWVTLGTVTGNNLVKRTVNFTAFTTDRIRINITRSLSAYSMLTEVEAWSTGTASDTTPDPFSFTAQNGAALSTLTTSNAITVSGINSAAPISIGSCTGTNCAYSTDNGSTWQTTAGTVTNGSLVMVRMTSSASNSTSTALTLNIGGVTGTFNVSTVASTSDSTPDPFTFTSRTGVALSTLTASNAITVSGINTAAPISIGSCTATNCAYSTDNGSTWQTTPGTVTNGNLVMVRMTSSASNSTATTLTLNIGGVNGTFSITTVASASSTNVSLAANGGVASASSTYSSGFSPSSLIDNQRTGAPWGHGGGWKDATPNSFPDWVQINFSGQQSIDHVVVYTLQDNYTNPVEPTDTMTFSLYGVTGFTVQGWNGSAWVTLGTVTGNNLVKRTVNFTAFTTDRIRVNITSSLFSYSLLTEVEAWGN